MRRLAPLLAVSLCALPSAVAEAAPSLAGHWTFTADIEADCDFGGTAHLASLDEANYAVELTARQSCLRLPEDYLVRQDCAASVLGNQVSVRCEIKEFLNGFESEYYFPDNFSLTIASRERLFGALISFGNADPAEWRRAESGIS